MDLYDRYCANFQNGGARLEQGKMSKPDRGLFSVFSRKGDPELTPPLIFVTAILYMMVSSGSIDAEEMGHLFTIIGGKNQKGVLELSKEYRQLVDTATRYRNQHSIDEFIAVASTKLTDAQKICLLLNLVESSLSDGEAEKGEQEVFYKFLRGFHISQERFAPFFQVLALKSDLSIFNAGNLPQNQAGYRVTLDVQSQPQPDPSTPTYTHL